MARFPPTYSGSGNDFRSWAFWSSYLGYSNLKLTPQQSGPKERKQTGTALTEDKSFQGEASGSAVMTGQQAGLQSELSGLETKSPVTAGAGARSVLSQPAHKWQATTTPSSAGKTNELNDASPLGIGTESSNSGFWEACHLKTKPDALMVFIPRS